MKIKFNFTFSTPLNIVLSTAYLDSDNEVFKEAKASYIDSGVYFQRHEANEIPGDTEEEVRVHVNKLLDTMTSDVEEGKVAILEVTGTHNGNLVFGSRLVDTNGNIDTANAVTIWSQDLRYIDVECESKAFNMITYWEKFLKDIKADKEELREALKSGLIVEATDEEQKEHSFISKMYDIDAYPAFQ